MPQSSSDLDMEKARKTAGHVFDQLGGALSSAMIYLGDRLGMYRAMESGEPMSSDELARRMGLHERWVREWLQQQASAGLIDYKGDGRFALSPESAMVLADENSPLFLAGGFCAYRNKWPCWNACRNPSRAGSGSPTMRSDLRARAE
jgi:hypothetical protein